MGELVFNDAIFSKIEKKRINSNMSEVNNSRKPIQSMHKQIDNGETVTVSVKALYDFMQEYDLTRTEYGLTVDVTDGYYYDLRNENGEIVCMDGEVCEVRGGYYNTDRWAVLYNAESEKEFKLTREEFRVACFVENNVNNSLGVSK